ncbi:hypothetical protein [Campylobacter sp. TTU_617]|uniref:hypothetical protein n=1 Tax=Campylobacter sp. TTU_617 TaxID=2768148 RepID=UPI001905430C|nr:hypothetical protein [Campylobacter sp. TTU_617]MBK1971005.1 hypothetical protein [Campylobacter sp. TTU_617]
MRKIFYGILAFIAIVFIICYVILFTSFGNSIVSNVVQNKVKQNLGFDLNITYFKLRPSSLELKTDLANIAHFNIDGNLSLFKLSFDLNYNIALQKDYAKSLGLNLNKNLEFNGKAYGKISDFLVNGKGYFLGSNVNLDSRIYDFNPIVLNLDAKSLKIEDILSFISMPAYAKGNIDIITQIQAKNLKPNGSANIKLDTSYINYERIQKDFGVLLPKSNINSTINALIKEDKIFAISNINTNYLNLKTQKTLYDITKNKLNSDFELKISDLSKLQNLTQIKLNGPLSIAGILELDQNILSNVNVNVNDIGEEVGANLQNNKIKIILKNAKIEKILKILGYESLSNGYINANIENLDLNFNKLNANANFDIKGILNAKALGNILNKQVSNNINFDLKANSIAKNNIANFNASLISDLLKIPNLTGSFDIKKVILNSKFDLILDDFSKLSFLADRKLSGKAEFNTKVNFDKNFDIELISKNLFNGKLEAIFKNNILNANLNDVELSELAKSLDFIDIYQGRADISANYDINNEKGDAKLDIKEGKLKSNAITTAVKILTLKDITTEVFHTSSAKANINKDLIDFNLDMQAKYSNININKATINLKTQAINLPFEASINKANFKGSITGTSENPKIKLDVGSIANSIKNVIGEKAKDQTNKVGEKIDKLFNKIF